MAVLVVAIIVAGSLEAAGSLTRAQRSLRDRQTAIAYADALLAEVAAKRYSRPADVTGLLVTLLNPYDRSNYLGVDDYALFSETTLRSEDGTQLTTQTGWSRSVSLSFVQPSSPTTTSLTDTGLRLITVTVSRNGTTLVTRATLRAKD